MNKSLATKIWQSRCLLALLAGFLLAASFPNWNVAGFAWIAPGLILFCGVGKTARQQFWLGYVAGVAHFLTSLYWLLFIPFPAGAVAGWLALSAYLSLYPALWSWLCWRIFRKFVQPDVSSGENLNANFGRLFLRTAWRHRAIWSLCCAAIWVALEMTMSRMFSGFPWNFLGVTQVKIVPLIQIASITGVYGISFLLVWFSVSLCCAGFLLVQRPQPAKAWSGEILIPALVVSVLFAWGSMQISPEKPDQAELKVALVQPSIPQTLIFDPSQGDNRFQKIMQLSEEALAGKPDLLIWPEASIPPLNAEQFSALTNFISTHGIWMVLGADDVEVGPDAKGRWETNYYNSSFLFAPDGTVAGTYRKRRLVIFGEYIPLGDWLPFMKWFTPIDGGFTRGKGPVQFETKSPDAKTAVLICFEDVFPHYAREHVQTDTDFLLNLTNDGWFGDSAAQWQQAFNAVFRAVENGLPLVRCTNNGLTCWIDQHGRLRKVFRSANSSVYAPGFLIADIPLLAPGEKRPPTFYRQYGDWFGWSCVAVAIVLLISARERALRK